MSEPVDRYDVEAMIRDACVRLRSEFARDLRELRDELGNERVDRQDADADLVARLERVSS